MTGMQLRGRYQITIGGETFTAGNTVTDEGLRLAALALCGTPLGAVGIGIASLGDYEGSDTTQAHPGWETLSAEQPSSVSAEGRAVVTPIHVLKITRDGLAGACFLTVGGALFSVATFEPRGVVAGDTIKVQYLLELAP